MSKAYIVTAVDYGETVDGKARTIGVFFDREKAQAALDADMDGYLERYKKDGIEAKEEDLAVWHDNNNGCEWNVEDVDVAIPLSIMQITTIHEIAAQVNDGLSSVAEADYLTEEEMNYLKYTLENTYHYNLSKEEK